MLTSQPYISYSTFSTSRWYLQCGPHWHLYSCLTIFIVATSHFMISHATLSIANLSCQNVIGMYTAMV